MASQGAKGDVFVLTYRFQSERRLGFSAALEKIICETLMIKPTSK